MTSGLVIWGYESWCSEMKEVRQQVLWVGGEEEICNFDSAGVEAAYLPTNGNHVSFLARVCESCWSFPLFHLVPQSFFNLPLLLLTSSSLLYQLMLLQKSSAMHLVRERTLRGNPRWASSLDLPSARPWAGRSLNHPSSWFHLLKMKMVELG